MPLKCLRVGVLRQRDGYEFTCIFLIKNLGFYIKILDGCLESFLKIPTKILNICFKKQKD